MTPVTAEQQRIEEAATSVTAKLASFREGLSPDERYVLGTAFWQVRAAGQTAPNDVTGYKDVLDIALRSVEQLPIWDGLRQMVAELARPIVWRD